MHYEFMDSRAVRDTTAGAIIDYQEAQLKKWIRELLQVDTYAITYYILERQNSRWRISKGTI